ncbi:MAG TPA: zf-HC2 domain-containing protein [Proteiniclasticum sp.]|nr:zf-HC2 domain-containing protein [Proteiniclasticum sp.]
MREEIGCSIVQDLLPSYIEKLTSEETDQVIRVHLDTCIECRKAYEEMISEVGIIDKAPKAELKFLKKIRKTRLIAAVISIVLTLILSYAVYAMEFEYSSDKTDLSNAVTEYTAPLDEPIEAYVLETSVVDGVLIASFKDRTHETVNGIAKFIKGLNNRYRIIGVQVESSEYSSVVQYYPFESNDEHLIAVSGYNLSYEIEYYGLDYSAYTRPGYLSDYRVRIPVKFETDNLQFLEIYKAEELAEIAMETQEVAVFNPHLTGSSFYDESGEEITGKFRIPESDIQNISYGGGKVELFMVYVFIVLIAGFGAIMTRYFLTD